MDGYHIYRVPPTILWSLPLLRKRLCQRRLQNIIRRHQNIIPTRLAITAKRPNIMTQDNTRTQRITLIQRELMQSMPEGTLKKQ